MKVTKKANELKKESMELSLRAEKVADRILKNVTWVNHYHYPNSIHVSLNANGLCNGYYDGKHLKVFPHNTGKPEIKTVIKIIEKYIGICFIQEV
jgi:hypothetical protein